MKIHKGAKGKAVCGSNIGDPTVKVRCKRCFPHHGVVICCRTREDDCSCSHQCDKCVVQIDDKIDPEIRDIIIEMNQRGFKTSASCSGIISKGHDSGQAYIAFDGERQKVFELFHEIQDYLNRTGVNK